MRTDPGSRKFHRFSGLLASALVATAVAACTDVQADRDAAPANNLPAGELTVRADQPSHAISPMLYGLMTEEINHSYDGGLYAELIQNRIFKDDKDKPVHWTGINGARISLDNTNPVNTTALTTSLKVELPGGARAGVANDGYWGIPVKPNTAYRVSFFAKA
jgi:alpha-N-arabinofuranosidase